MAENVPDAFGNLERSTLYDDSAIPDRSENRAVRFTGCEKSDRGVGPTILVGPTPLSDIPRRPRIRAGEGRRNASILIENGSKILAVTDFGVDAVGVACFT
jgi:hypothetical protein